MTFDLALAALRCKHTTIFLSNLHFDGANLLTRSGDSLVTLLALEDRLRQSGGSSGSRAKINNKECKVASLNGIEIAQKRISSRVSRGNINVATVPGTVKQSQKENKLSQPQRLGRGGQGSNETSSYLGIVFAKKAFTWIQQTDIRANMAANPRVSEIKDLIERRRDLKVPDIVSVFRLYFFYRIVWSRWKHR
jgi:hypothetical protein